MGHCCVFGCVNNSRDRRKGGRKKVSFHRFPANEALKDQWIKAICREHWHPSQYTVICSEHFEEKYINRTYESGRVELRDNAIPTIFPNKSQLSQTLKPRKLRRPRASSLSDEISPMPIPVDVEIIEDLEPVPEPSKVAPEPIPEPLKVVPKPVPEPSKVVPGPNPEPLILLSTVVDKSNANHSGPWRLCLQPASEPAPKPSTSNIAVQAVDSTLSKEVEELKNKNLQLEWKVSQLSMRIEKQTKLIKKIRKQNSLLTSRLSSAKVSLSPLQSQNLIDES